MGGALATTDELSTGPGAARGAATGAAIVPDAAGPAAGGAAAAIVSAGGAPTTAGPPGLAVSGRPDGTAGVRRRWRRRVLRFGRGLAHEKSRLRDLQVDIETEEETGEDGNRREHHDGLPRKNAIAFAAGPPPACITVAARARCCCASICARPAREVGLRRGAAGASLPQPLMCPAMQRRRRTYLQPHARHCRRGRSIRRVGAILRPGGCGACAGRRSGLECRLERRLDGRGWSLRADTGLGLRGLHPASLAVLGGLLQGFYEQAHRGADAGSEE